MIEITRRVYSKEQVPKIVEGLLMVGFSEVIFRETDLSSCHPQGGEVLEITASTRQWRGRPHE